MRHSLITFSLALILPVAASASTYDLVSDFSASSNPNGVWSYGYGTPGVSFTQDDVNGTSYRNAVAWNYWAHNSEGSDLPVVAQNNTGTAAPGSNLGIDFPLDVLLLHPGQIAIYSSIVEFTAPVSGNYNFSGFFEHLDSGGTGVIATAFDGSVPEFSATIPGTDNTATPFSFDFSGYVAAGHSVSFDLSPNGSYASDSTGLALTVTGPTPEPSSLALLGTGILGLAGVARRKLRS